MGKGCRGIRAGLAISLSHFLLFWHGWKVEAANVQVWEVEENALFQDKTIVGSVVLGAGGRSASACAMLSLTNNHDLFAYSKSLQTCHAITTNNVVFVQSMDSMNVFKKKGTVVANKTFDGDFLRTLTSTYQVVKTKVNRDTARSLCTAAGSQLVVINTLEKQNLLRDLLNTYSSYFRSFDFWIEGSQDEDTWTFPDGTLVPMGQGTFWSSGTPNNDDQHCVRMRRESDYLWDDNMCNSDYGYICETP